jgi:alpha-galactosidase
MLEQMRTVRPYYYGDYYPLTPYSQDNNVWIAWQFDCPERGEGAVQAFRRGQCPTETARLALRGLEPDARYTITNLDDPTPIRMTGRDLATGGLPVTIKARPGAAVIVYKR